MNKFQAALSSAHSEARPPLGSVSTEFLASLCAATAAIARLDERLRMAEAPLATGWLPRALLKEAVASARLSGLYIQEEDLLLLDHDTLDRAPDQALGQAHHLLQMLRSVARRSPRQLFTPLRLIAATRRRLAPPRQGVSPLPPWLEDRRVDPSEMIRALHAALERDAVRRWEGLPPVLGATEMLGRWHAVG